MSKKAIYPDKKRLEGIKEAGKHPTYQSKDIDKKYFFVEKLIHEKNATK